MSLLGWDQDELSRLIHMKWLHLIAVFDRFFVMLTFSLSLKPNKLKTFKDGFETNPLAPTSIVLQYALNPFPLASSSNPRYFSVFLILHEVMFSSAGEVSSIKQTFFALVLWIQMSGLRFELAISGGMWYCFCLVSISIFQSLACPQKHVWGFFLLLGFTPFLTNCIKLLSELHECASRSCFTLLSFKCFTIVNRGYPVVGSFL